MATLRFIRSFTSSFLLLLIGTSAHAQTVPPIPIHDPVMIRQDSTYYAFATGRGIRVWSSKDMKNWKAEKPVFESAPAWTTQANPATRANDFWAPDISYHKGRYYLFYSSSVFGKNSSAIGLATNTTLHPTDPNYKWVDQGLVIQSVPGRDNWNAIDPNMIVDSAGRGWLTFGSFWGGMKLVRLRDDFGGPASPAEWYTVASRPRTAESPDKEAGNGAIEAPFLFRKSGYYYLFVSFDYCCRGPKSTYKMVVGRSASLTGPYLDRDGKPMNQGGGSLVLAGDKDWYGVGHNATYTFDGVDYLVYHGYDAADGGKSKLQIRALNWDEAGWPVVK